MKTTIQARAQQALTKFLTRKDYEIQEIDWSCDNECIDLVAKDLEGEALAFITCQISTTPEMGFPKEVNDREKLERLAAAYLKDHDFGDCRIRFDNIALLVLNEDRAFLRHHINTLGSSD